MCAQKKYPVVKMVVPKSHTKRSKSKSNLLFTENEAVLLQSISETTSKFCTETTLHGVRNIREAFHQLWSRTATRQQKLYNIISLIIWCSAFCAGIVFAVILMQLIWERFQRTPTITTVETNNYPIWNIEFPAVTVCNNNKVYGPIAQRMAQMLSTDYGFDPTTVHQYFTQLGKLVSTEYVNCDEDFNQIAHNLARLNYTTDRLMYELMQPCEHMIANCSWLGQSLPCEQLFRVAKSSEGFCCSFNYKAPLDFLEVDQNHKYIDDQLDDPVYRVSGAGPYVGLDALIRIAPDAYTAYTKPYYGATIMIHGSRVYPQAGDKTTFGQPGCDVTVAVIPSVVVSQPAIRGLSLADRNCFFDDERRLRTTTKYTYQSCISECAVDTILRVCQCLPYFYMEVRLRTFFEGWRQCTLNDSVCLRDNRHIFYSLQPDNVNVTLGKRCDYCLPSCSEENYEVQTIISRRSNDRTNLSSVLYANIDLTESVTMKVHFKDISCIKYRRDVFMTWDGLFASFGGIFGLCLGGSIISLVEFVYFFTFKLYEAVQQRRQHVRVTSRRQEEQRRQRSERVEQLLMRCGPPPPANGVKWMEAEDVDVDADIGDGVKEMLRISVVSTSAMDKQSGGGGGGGEQRIAI